MLKLGRTINILYYQAQGQNTRRARWCEVDIELIGKSGCLEAASFLMSCQAKDIYTSFGRDSAVACACFGYSGCKGYSYGYNACPRFGIYMIE